MLLVGVDFTLPVRVKFDVEGLQNEFNTTKVLNEKTYITWYYNGNTLHKHTIEADTDGDGIYAFKDVDGNELSVGDLTRVQTFGVYLDNSWEASSNFAYVGMDSVKVGYFRVFGEGNYFTNEFRILYMDAETGKQVWESKYIDEEKGLFGESKLYQFADLPLVAGYEYVPNESLSGAWKIFGYIDQTIKINVKVLDTDYTALDALIEEVEKYLEETNSANYGEEELKALNELLEACKGLKDSGFTYYQPEVDEFAKQLEEAFDAYKDSYVAPDKTGLAEAITKAEELNKEDYTTESYKEVEKALEEAKKVLANENASQQEVNAALEALNEALDGLAKLEDKTDTPDTSDMTNIAGYAMLMLAAAGMIVLRKKEVL